MPLGRRPPHHSRRAERSEVREGDPDASGFPSPRAGAYSRAALRRDPGGARPGMTTFLRGPERTDGFISSSEFFSGAVRPGRKAKRPQAEAGGRSDEEYCNLLNGFATTSNE